VHAAGESVREPLSDRVSAVVLAASREELEVLKARLEAACVSFKAISDPDTDFGDELLALGVTPGSKRVLGRLFKGLPLLK
jgi:hypothetical protein